MTLKIHAAQRVQATDENKTVKQWIGTNGRYAELLLVAEIIVLISKSKSESADVDSASLAAAKAIVANKATTFEQFDAWGKACTKDAAAIVRDAVAGAKSSLKSAKTDYTAKD